MGGAAQIVELIFGALGLVPAQPNARVVEASAMWNYTTSLNIALLVLAGLLVLAIPENGRSWNVAHDEQPAAMGTPLGL
jgi:uncharacterized protein